MTLIKFQSQWHAFKEPMLIKHRNDLSQVHHILQQCYEGMLAFAVGKMWVWIPVHSLTGYMRPVAPLNVQCIDN